MMIADPFYDRDQVGVFRCSTCDRVLEGFVRWIDEWCFCEEHWLKEMEELAKKEGVA